MSVTKDIIANYSGQGWVAMMNLVFVPYYIDILGVESFGLIGVFVMLQTVVSILDLGMSPTLSREMSRFVSGAISTQSIRDLLRTVETFSLGIALLILGTATLLSQSIANLWFRSDHLGVDVIAGALWCMALVVSVKFVENIYKGALLGLRKQVGFNLLNVIFTTLRQVGALVSIIYVSPSINVFLNWQALVATASLISMSYYVYVSLPQAERPGRFSLQSIRHVQHFAFGIIGITALSLLLTQIDKILLSRMLSLQDFGYYSLATMIAGVFSLLVTPISQAIYPRFVSYHSSNDQKQLIDTYHLASQLVSVLVAPLALVLACNGYGVIFGWTGDPVVATSAGPILALMSIGSLCNCLVWIPYQCMLANGWTKLALIINLVAVFVLVPALPFVIPIYGGLGAAAVWTILNLGYLVFFVHFFHCSILKNEKWEWYCSDLAKPILTSFLTIVVFLVIPFPRTTAFQWIVFLAASLVVSSVASLMAASRIRELCIGTFISLRNHVIGS